MLIQSAVVATSFVFSERFYQVALANAVLQLIWFLFSVHIPAFRTGRMSYVDVAWPWGLVILGVLPLLHPASNIIVSWNSFNRGNMVAIAYLVAGLRMGCGGLILLKKGHLSKELPRYMYQRRRWERRGIIDENSFMFQMEMQKEIFVQCLANIGILSTPLLLQAFGYLTPHTPFTYVEILGWFLWTTSILFEHVADMQKQKFAIQCKKDGVKNALCNVGLWRFSRHPNYFGEWMVWNSLVLTSIPSLIALWHAPEEYIVVKLVMTAALVSVSYGMYNCLVYYTGAIPAEYYSSQKRPLYTHYQNSVNMFFPGPCKD